MHESVPSGLCSPNREIEPVDGPLRVKGHPRNGERLTVFPFATLALDRGKTPWDDWVLICWTCPWRTDPPESIQRLLDQRAQLDQQLGRYEAAENLEAREAIAAELARADPPADP